MLADSPTYIKQPNCADLPLNTVQPQLFKLLKHTILSLGLCFFIRTPLWQNGIHSPTACVDVP